MSVCRSPYCGMGWRRQRGFVGEHVGVALQSTEGDSMSDINGFAAADFPDDARTPVGDDLPGQETDAEAIFRERLEEQDDEAAGKKP
jgi:hypothetical protein